VAELVGDERAPELTAHLWGRVEDKPISKEAIAKQRSKAHRQIEELKRRLLSLAHSVVVIPESHSEPHTSPK
jgi:hypothetical protein